MGKPRLARMEDNAEERPERVEDQWQSAAEITPKKATFLWPGRLLDGAPAILEGEKGVGKSTLVAAIVAAITAGEKLHGRRKRPPAAVIWLAGEEDASRAVRPRLQAAGADLRRVHFPAEDERGVRRRILLPHHLGVIESAIRHFGAAMIVVDPLSSFVDTSMDLRNDQNIHTVLDPLADICGATDCVALLVRHLTKDSGASRINRGMGGAAVGGVARSILCIDWPDRRTARRVLRVVACNIGSPTPSLEYVLEDKAGFPVMSKVRELPSAEDDPNGDCEDLGERDVRKDAAKLLRSLIGAEWVSAAAVIRESENAAIGLRTLRTVKADLGVQSRRVGRATPAYWEWGPPKSGWEEGG